MITNLADICYLKHLPNLRTLWLSDNPCAVGDRYRLTVLKTLPNLHKLDNIAVQVEELNDAIEQGLDLHLPESSRSPSKSSSQRPQSAKKDKDRSPVEDPDKLTLEQTNKIREELGLKPVPTEKYSPVKHYRPGGSKARQANLLQAALCLVKELDVDSLEAVGNAVKDRLEAL
ncbi:protein C21orf2 [Lingula anatina]|uniref:Protein C21orf2 n=1 Tax=Lingula anatina TaxID=7574 RepID=A0A1S3JKY6_LINAN|nr:protein C21orf2 [Lingula anatina]|eukprot:XP_013411075.2 protein C21orf2 [Lingula anatina]